MQLNLTGKTALVTGATGQLGRVIARTLAACGANVALHYISNEAKAMELQHEIEAIGRQAVIVQGDITKQDTTFRIRDEIESRLSGVDIVVANAVIQYEWTSVLEQAPEDYVSQFESCVMQSVYLAKAFIPHMQHMRAGRFIGINTECAMQNFAHQSAYTAGKRGMDGVYRVLAKEVGEYQITVNQVAPGWTISERDRASEPGHDEAYTRTVPLKRRGEDQEIANVVAFLASDLASFITGAYIPVSGWQCNASHINWTRFVCEEFPFALWAGGFFYFSELIRMIIVYVGGRCKLDCANLLRISLVQLIHRSFYI